MQIQTSKRSLQSAAMEFEGQYTAILFALWSFCSIITFLRIVARAKRRRVQLFSRCESISGFAITTVMTLYGMRTGLFKLNKGEMIRQLECVLNHQDTVA